MNDLNQINENNARAIEREIPAQLAAGKFVVAEYAGLHFIRFETFDTEGPARDKLETLRGRSDSTWGKLFTPTAGADAPEIAGPKEITPPIEPEPPVLNLVPGAAHVAALVLVYGNPQQLVSVPAQTFATVIDQGSGAIVALTGPVSEAGAVRDSAVFAAAFKMRQALTALAAEVRRLQPEGLFDKELADADAALDLATPQIVRMSRPEAVQPPATDEEGVPRAGDDTSPSESEPAAA